MSIQVVIIRADVMDYYRKLIGFLLSIPEWGNGIETGLSLNGSGRWRARTTCQRFVVMQRSTHATGLHAHTHAHIREGRVPRGGSVRDVGFALTFLRNTSLPLGGKKLGYGSPLFFAFKTDINYEKDDFDYGNLGWVVNME